MTAKRQNASGTIQRCSCGRVILHIQTSKNTEADSIPNQKKQAKHHPRGLKAFASRGKKNETRNGSVAHANLCLDCSRKSKNAADRKNDKLNRVKVAGSLSKFASKKKDFDSSNENKIPPREISLFMSEEAAPTPLTDAARAEEFDNCCSTPKVIKKAPSRFTFEGLGMSTSTTLSSILGMSMDDSKDDRSTILSDLEKTDASLKSAVQQPTASAPSLEDTDQSDMSQVTGDNLIIPWRGSFHQTSTAQRSRGKSKDSELSIEFSESDFLMAKKDEYHKNGPSSVTDSKHTENYSGSYEVTGGEIQVKSPSQHNEEGQADVETNFDCETGENLFWVFDFNPPKAAEEESLRNMLHGSLAAKQVWFDLSSLFGIS